jgi:hypothetical protein
MSLSILTACEVAVPDPADTDGPSLTVTLNERDANGSFRNYTVASSPATSERDRTRFQCAALNASGRTYEYRNVSRGVYGPLGYPEDHRSVNEGAAVFMRRGQIPNFTLLAEDESGIRDIRIEVIEGGVFDGVDTGRNDSGMTVLAPTNVTATNVLGTNLSGQRRYLRVAETTYDSPFVLQPMQIELSRFTSELVRFTATDFVGNRRTTRVYWLPEAFCVDTRPGF